MPFSIKPVMHESDKDKYVTKLLSTGNSTIKALPPRQGRTGAPRADPVQLGHYFKWDLRVEKVGGFCWSLSDLRPLLYLACRSSLGVLLLLGLWNCCVLGRADWTEQPRLPTRRGEEPAFTPPLSTQASPTQQQDPVPMSDGEKWDESSHQECGMPSRTRAFPKADIRKSLSKFKGIEVFFFFLILSIVQARLELRSMFLSLRFWTNGTHHL